MADRLVSVKIRAAFDTAFNATFSTADERIKSMQSALRGLKATAADIQGMKQSREEIARLTSDISGQKTALIEATEARKKAQAAIKPFEDAEGKAAEARKKSHAVWKEKNDAYAKEKSAIAALDEPSKDQIENLERLRKEADEALETHRANREELTRSARSTRDHQKATAEAGNSVEIHTRKEKELRSGLKATENQLKKTEENALKYSESLRKAGVNVDKLDDEERKLNQTMERRKQLVNTQKRAKRYSGMADDLRSEAFGHMFTAAGTGYMFMRPLRDAIAFEKQMTRVIAMSGATSEEYRRLKDDARRLGAETVYSALQVADAQNELATAGFRTGQILTTMPYMLALANSSMTGLARTAEITASVMQGFNLDVTEMGRIGDALTAAYTSSASSLESLGEMLKYVAPVASVVGSGLEEVLGASSVLHNNAITGSMAGTTLRAFFLRLSDPPRETEKMLDQMNVKTKDGAGNMRNYLDILRDVNAALKGSGTARQAEAWKKLAGEEHAPGVAKLADAEASGALQLEIKKYKLAPAFGQLGTSLLKMPDAAVNDIATTFGVKFNRALSGGGMVMNLAGSLQGLKGGQFESQLQRIFQKIGIAPKLLDIKPEEFQAAGKKAEAAINELGINPLKALGGRKSNEEMTREIKSALQTLPLQDQLRYVDTLFSKTRSNMREMFKEFAHGGRNADQLVQALGETLNMEKTRKALSETAANDLEQIAGDFGDMSVSLGESLIPLLKEFTSWLKPITEGLAKWIKENQGWARA
ncbi:MAG: phage tail tape measure protein, partial [Pseudobdellovibrionaceae bacterium]|nr:phage tail tape measure protein [Pseudobdellovibrionaceae bacterium]